MYIKFDLGDYGLWMVRPKKDKTYTVFTPSKSRHRVHFVILMMTKDKHKLI